MINGVHALIYSSEAEDVRAFFRDVLEWPSVDAGGGWLICACPPTELAVHPAAESSHELYLMCDDLQRTVAELEEKGVAIPEPVRDEVWGKVTALALPGGSVLGLYEPKHPSPLDLGM